MRELFRTAVSRFFDHSDAGLVRWLSMGIWIKSAMVLLQVAGVVRLIVDDDQKVVQVWVFVVSLIAEVTGVGASLNWVVKLQVC